MQVGHYPLEANSLKSKQIRGSVGVAVTPAEALLSEGSGKIPPASGRF
jgi:hypothetical protein